MNIESDRTEAVEKLANIIAHYTDDQNLLATDIDGFYLFQYREAIKPATTLYEPSICLMAQGSKLVHQGNESFVYDSQHYLITSVHLPAIFQIKEASTEKPILGLKMLLDKEDMAKLMADSKLPPPKVQQSSRGMAIGTTTAELLSAFQRLIELQANPRDIPILGENIKREIYYRLLVGDQGTRLRQIVTAGSQSHQISRVIYWLNENYKEQIRVDSLAELAGMSTSTFHSHFRSMTALSPLQYQKQLRLREARRLMLSNEFDAADAAFEVGYESPSQFSREYSRLFGVPPKRDIKNLSLQN